jgi:hypothetical protein
MVKKVAQEKDPEVRKTRIKEIHEKYGRPWLQSSGEPCVPKDGSPYCITLVL